MTSINFNSENLKIDYLSLNLQFNNIKQIEEIAYFLADTFHCRSTLVDQSSKKRHLLTKTNKNRYSAEFVVNLNKHWRGMTLRFKGKHAQCFYNDLQFQKLDWSIFDLTSTNLGRVDLYYDRELKANDKDLHLFFENSYKQINSKNGNPTAKIGNNILRIGKRSSSNYYRVYQKTKRINYDLYSEMNNGLKFELELKNQLVKSFQKFLFNNHIEEFEGRLIEYFYKQSKKSFVLDSCYIDWLLIRMRKHFSKENNQTSLVSSYLDLEKPVFDSFIQKERFFKILQFLSFVRNLKNFKKNFVSDQLYYLIEFPVIDFLKFTGFKENNKYQRRKTLNFFSSLQEEKRLIQKFSDKIFRSSTMFPYLKLEKQGRAWVVSMAIGKEIYGYNYPFFFPEVFLTSSTKYDLEIKLQFISCISIEGLEKKFAIESFLKKFSVSNNKKTEIKRLIIELFKILEKNKLIENELKLVYKTGKNKTIIGKELTPLMITKSEYISFNEIFH